MTAEEFTKWIAALIEKNQGKGLSKRQTQIVKEKIKEVQGTIARNPTGLILSC